LNEKANLLGAVPESGLQTG